MTEHDRKQSVKELRKLINEKFGKDCKHQPGRETEYYRLMEAVKLLEAIK